jgi:hypothetical protein
MSSKPDRDAYIELLDETGNWVVGLGLISLTIFPLALPLIALTAILVIPVLLGGLLIAVLAAPVLLVRRALTADRTAQPAELERRYVRTASTRP